MFEERKVVSVLFCDLVGFTASSEAADPEDVRARIRPYHARLRQEIERFGGTVEKFVGDAVMAVFGAPVAHEDDAERAVRAALGILDAIGELNEADPGLDLNVRVGVNTGEAVVALGARPELGESLVTGDVVNTANRIEGAAPVGGVAVGEQTYRTTSHIFEYKPLAPVLVKGKSEPLALWRANAVRIRFGTDVHEHMTPFVGRELEKPLLIGIFERALQRRTVQLVTIVGEPGVGKSRMVAELFVYMDAKPEIIRWRQGRCLPYGEGITFWALGEIVKREAAILESDSAEVAAVKLEAAVPPDETERQWLIQRLAPLVGAGAAPAERQESFTAWRRYLEGLAAARDTVLVFEDLHWADEALLAFLEHLAEWSEDVPLLILCTARPELYERRPGWGAGQRNAHTINLSPLSDEETAELVSALAARRLVQPQLRDAILERAGGNPLFAEEFVRLLVDRGLAAGEGALPETVHALIAARLDTLPPERKSLLQDAAVVGKVFWSSTVAQIAGLDQSEVELALHDLTRKELVRPARTSSMEGETEYAFLHLLVRDVAYGQIPRAERVRRHRAAAAWIERKGGERVEDLAEVLAHHYLQALELADAAGDTVHAAEVVPSARRFLALAGERALGLDVAQAVERLQRALDLTPEADPERARLLVRWADAAGQAGMQREAADALDQAIATLQGRDDRRAVARALQLRSRVSLVSGEGRHVPLAAEAARLLEEDGPTPELVEAYAQLANANAIAGRYAEAIDAADRAESVAAELGLPAPARAIGYRGFARVYRGDRRGLEEMQWARDRLVEAGAGRDLAVLDNNLAIARYPFDGPETSLRTFEDAVAFCDERGLVEVSGVLNASIPGLLIELGRVDEALALSERLGVEYEGRSVTQFAVEVEAVELQARVARGDQSLVERAEQLVSRAKLALVADLEPYAVASAAAAFAVDAPERLVAVLTDLERSEGASGSPYYARCLPRIVRSALAVGRSDLADRLLSRLTSRYPLAEHATCAVRAALAEDVGELDAAAALYADAAERWREFGNVPERADALFGQGRCLRAARPLREARELFAAMGYARALAEVDALLAAAETVV